MVETLYNFYSKYKNVERQIKDLERSINASRPLEPEPFVPSTPRTVSSEHKPWICFLLFWTTGIGSFIYLIIVYFRVKQYNAEFNQRNKEAAEREVQAYPQKVKNWENTVLKQIQLRISKLRNEAAEHLAAIESSTILPPRYKDVDFQFYGEHHPICAIYDYLTDGRVDNVKEAINLYVDEEREAKRDYEAKKHQAEVLEETTKQTQFAERTAKAAEKAADEALQTRIARDETNKKILREQKRANSQAEYDRWKMEEKIKEIKDKV